MSQLYNSTVEAIADASGVATARFGGPEVMQDVIAVDAISLRSDSAALPDASLFRGPPSTGQRLAYTQNGRSGTWRRSGGVDVINGGDTWTVQWTRCTPGSSCSAALSGLVMRRSAALG